MTDRLVGAVDAAWTQSIARRRRREAREEGAESGGRLGRNRERRWEQKRHQRNRSEDPLSALFARLCVGERRRIKGKSEGTYGLGRSGAGCVTEGSVMD
jgi:hypothetical protein